METIIRSGHKSLQQMLVEATGDHGPNQYQRIQQDPSTELQDLRRALLDSQNQNLELVSYITAVREQAAAKESSLEEEKERILKALRSERAISKQAKMDLKQKEKEKQELMLEKQNEIQLMNQWWTDEFNRAWTVWQEENKKVSESWDSMLQHELNQKKLMMESLKEESDRMVSQVVLEKEDLITQLSAAKTALAVQTLESEAQLQEKEQQIIQSEAEWETKLTTLEDLLRSELAAKDETIQELQRMNAEMDQQWEEKLSQMHDQIQLQTKTITDLQALNLSLQELLQKPALEEVKVTSEEMMAKKVQLKRLIEQRKQEEKREKKEREKSEREESKRLKKEKKAREEKEKEDLKREKKEKGRREGRNVISSVCKHHLLPFTS